MIIRVSPVGDKWCQFEEHEGIDFDHVYSNQEIDLDGNIMLVCSYHCQCRDWQYLEEHNA